MPEASPLQSPAPRLPGSEIRRRLQAQRAASPGLRARDLARNLGLSEAELVAARCGEAGEERALRLDARWPELVQALPALGRVMVLTRNEHCVHEKHGRFDKISIFERQGLVLDPEIDLRLFFAHWHHGFAVSELVRSGLRQSLQIFDLDGTAVHKIYATGETDRAAWAALVEAFTAAEQSPELAVVPPAPPPADAPDEAIDRQALRARWDALQDTHDFFPLLRDLGVGRVQAFRLAGPAYAQPLAPRAFRRALEAAAADALPIMVFVGSPGVIQIHSGPVVSLRETGPWFNVLDPGFNLHLHEPGIATAWLVRKPSRDGQVTSLELFDVEGRQIAWMFGARKPGQPELPAWRGLAEALAQAEA